MYGPYLYQILIFAHCRLPQQYVGPRYPLLHAAISQDGMDIAVAGTQGLGLYSRRSSRWRLFGDISQEREIMVQVSAYVQVQVYSMTAARLVGQPACVHS